MISKCRSSPNLQRSNSDRTLWGVGSGAFTSISKNLQDHFIPLTRYTLFGAAVSYERMEEPVNNIDLQVMKSSKGT